MSLNFLNFNYMDLTNTNNKYKKKILVHLHNRNIWHCKIPKYHSKLQIKCDCYKQGRCCTNTCSN